MGELQEAWSSHVNVTTARQAMPWGSAQMTAVFISVSNAYTPQGTPDDAKVCLVRVLY